MQRAKLQRGRGQFRVRSIVDGPERGECTLNVSLSDSFSVMRCVRL
jgi:hypothetical protein